MGATVASAAAFVLRRAWPSYLLIVLLQAKRIWRMWDFKDLTSGDTSAYFLNAWGRRHGFNVNIVWSPLYTAFYGSFLWLSDNAYVATTVHRITIVVLCAMGVLFVLRRVVSPPVALLGAAWWAILPINFDTLYEVHLFALLPVLLAWSILLLWDAPWARGTAVAIMAAASILVRNEFSIVAGAMAILALAYDWRRRAPGVGFAGTVVRAYGLPLIGAAAAVGFAYWRSTSRFPAIFAALEVKHGLNMCQVFAFGYQQRYSDFAGSPWTGCEELTRATFGVAWPSIGQMLSGNLSATLEHFWWNLRLAPNGLQALLFNAMSGRVNPDYAAVRSTWYPLPLSIALVALLVAGAWAARRDWSSGARAWVFARARAMIAALPFLLVAIPVILTQQPRPSYLFAISVIAIGLACASLDLVIRQVRVARRIVFTAAPLIVAALIVALPSYYARNTARGRPLLEKYESLLPHVDVLRATAGRWLMGEFAAEVSNYLYIRGREGGAWNPRTAVLSNELLARWDDAVPIDRFLREQGIVVFYVDPHVFARLRGTPQNAAFLDEPGAAGWRVLGRANLGDRSWALLARP